MILLCLIWITTYYGNQLSEEQYTQRRYSKAGHLHHTIEVSRRDSAEDLDKELDLANIMDDERDGSNSLKSY
jgi:hypothetical protein